MLTTREYRIELETNVSHSTEEQLQSSIRNALREVRATGSPTMEPEHFKQLTAEIRDNLSIVRDLQELFAKDRLDLLPRLWERSWEIDRNLDAVFAELCDIVDAATQLRDNDYQSMMETLIVRLAGVYHELRNIDQEETDLLFESFWQDIGVGD